jgi:hypothetical protein
VYSYGLRARRQGRSRASAALSYRLRAYLLPNALIRGPDYSGYQSDADYNVIARITENTPSIPTYDPKLTAGMQPKDAG